jgi:hypothetical protein
MAGVGEQRQAARPEPGRDLDDQKAAGEGERNKETPSGQIAQVGRVTVGVAVMLMMTVVMVVVSVVIVTAVVALLGHSAAYYTPIGYLTSDGFDPFVTEPTAYRR